MLIVAFAKLMDPILFSTALVLGAVVGRWWAAALIGGAIATLCQLFLQEDSPTALAAAGLAYIASAVVGYALRKGFRSRVAGNVLCSASVSGLIWASFAVFFVVTADNGQISSRILESTFSTSYVDPMEPLYRDKFPIRRTQYTPSQMAARHMAFWAQLPHSIADDVRLALTAGANITANLRVDYERNVQAGDSEPTFDNVQWIEDHRVQIPINEAWRFMHTKNADDSALLLQQLDTRQQTRELLAARGIS